MGGRKDESGQMRKMDREKATGRQGGGGEGERRER